MRSKLALRNAARSVKDYGIYFITLVFGVCVFYMFNSIYEQQAMIGLTKEMSDSIIAIQNILSYVSLFVLVVLGFLIVYANSFFIRRRKKEIGVYLTLGMEKSDIATILVMETSIIAIAALIVGLILGVFLSQFTSILTAKLFEADMTHFSFVFSFPEMIKSVVCFLIIFVVVIVFNVGDVTRYRLIELLYGNRQNQTLRIKSNKLMIIIFFISVVMLSLSYYFIVASGLMNIDIKFFVAILFGSAGTLLFFYSLAGLITETLRANKNIYFKNLNMFVIRQLGSKINTNFVSVSVVSIVLLFTIVIFATGYGLQDSMAKELKRKAGYDFSFYAFLTDDKVKIDPFSSMKQYIENTDEVSSYYNFRLYYSKPLYSDFNVPLSKEITGLTNEKLPFVALTDYNECMKLQGKEYLELEKDQYAILTNYKKFNEFADNVVENNSPLIIDENVLKPSESIYGCVINGFNTALIIVPDHYLMSMTHQESVLNLNCKNKESVALFEKKLNEYNSQSQEPVFTYYYSKSKIMADAIGQKAMLSFVSIYLGIVFLITCAAILAIQQLTEAEDNKFRYELLGKMGVEKQIMNKAIFTQIFYYFLFPLLLAMVHAYFGLAAVVKTLKTYNDINIALSSAVTALFIIGIYVVYFIITYIGSKNIIYKI